jgi:hypothetical protein
MSRLVVDVDNWHWRFRRDAINIAPEVSIEHDIADDGYLSPLQRSEV